MGTGRQEQRAALTQGEVLPLDSSRQSEGSYEVTFYRRGPSFTALIKENVQQLLLLMVIL